MDAFKRYGVAKGFTLTAWRLLRCTPWGNSGYDPVRWPPPGLEALFGGSSDGSGDGGGGKP
jgi:putative component of membrane protein insertase Oxa1/YidC/SpoIIIJ protein YidD